MGTTTRHILSQIGKGLLGLIAATVIMIIVLFLYINTPPGRHQLSEIASQALGRQVQLNGALYPKFAWPPTLHVAGLTIANMEGGRTPMMAQIGQMDIAVQFQPLFHRRLRLASLALKDSQLNLERPDNHHANWLLGNTASSAETKEDFTFNGINALFLENSTLTYWDAPQKTDLTIIGQTVGDGVQLTGDGKHLGKAFKFNADIGSVIALQSGRHPFPIDMHLEVGHTIVTAKGTMSDIANVGQGDFALDIQGADASELFPLLGIALPLTPPYALKGQLTFDHGIWHFNHFTGRLGDSDLAGDLAWDTTRKRPKLTAEFLSKNLYFKDLAPFIGTAPDKVVSAQQQQLAIKEEISPRVIPDIPLDIARIAAMDADVKFTGQHVISGDLPLDNFFMHVLLQDRILQLLPLKFGTANGDVSGNIIINAQQEPVQNTADVTLHKLSLARLMGGMKNMVGHMKTAEGYIGGVVKLKGPGKSLHEMLGHSSGTVGFGMDGGKISELLVQLIGLDVAKALGLIITGDSYIPIRCVVGSFAVQAGVMHSQALVMDTSASNIQASGTINFLDEGMKLTVNPYPKDPSLLSLRSPIHIEGTLKNPQVDLDRSALAQKGVVAGGLALLAPVAAFLGFVDPALGKDSDCAALIREVKANTGAGKLVPKNKK